MPGEGSGADGKQRPWEYPAPDECDTPGMDEYDQQMLEHEVALKVEQWQKEKGNVPGNLNRFADQILRPKVDPFKAAAVKYAVTAVNGLGDYTWRKLARRQAPGSTPGVSAATVWCRPRRRGRSQPSSTTFRPIKLARCRTLCIWSP